MTEPGAQAEAAQNTPPSPVIRNRIMLLAMMFLSMLPLTAALVFYYGGSWVEGARTNRGTLLDPPARLDELDLYRDGVPVMAVGPRRWRLVIFFPQADSADLIRQHLHSLRQLHVRLGRDRDRLLRLAAFSDAPAAAVRAELASAFPMLELVTMTPGRLQQQLAQRQLRGGWGEQEERGEQAVLIIDPLGNVVAIYGYEQIGEDLLADLKRLLHLSNIG